MQSETLIGELIEQTKQHISKANQLKQLDDRLLQWRPEQEAWNVLECLEHLNLYGDFYLPQMEQAIKQSATEREAVFKPGILGAYFAKSMLPGNKPNKMKTFKDKNPIGSNLNCDVIDRFIRQQMKTLELLQQARKVSLNKIKISTSISMLIRLKLGDTFRFLINHIIRHMMQIERIEMQLPKKAEKA